MSGDISPFAFVDSVSNTKVDLVREEGVPENAYNPYLTNRSLSFFPDAVFDAQEMNRCSDLDGIMQYDYLRLVLRKKKRFTKWMKKQPLDDVKMVSEAFGMSLNKARDAVRALTQEQLSEIKSSRYKGG